MALEILELVEFLARTVDLGQSVAEWNRRANDRSEQIATERATAVTARTDGALERLPTRREQLIWAMDNLEPALSLAARCQADSLGPRFSTVETAKFSYAAANLSELLMRAVAITPLERQCITELAATARMKSSELYAETLSVEEASQLTKAVAIAKSLLEISRARTSHSSSDA
jgi:hypothetical protein